MTLAWGWLAVALTAQEPSWSDEVARVRAELAQASHLGERADELLGLYQEVRARALAPDPGQAPFAWSQLGQLLLRFPAEVEGGGLRVEQLIDDVLQAASLFPPDQSGASDALHVVGQLYRESWHDAALELVDAGLVRFRDVPVALTAFHVLAADVERILGRWSEALASLERAEALLLDEDPSLGAPLQAYHQTLRAGIYGARGQLWLDLGIWSLASHWLERELEVARACASPTALANSVAHRGELVGYFEDWQGIVELCDEFLSSPAASEVEDSVRARLLAQLGHAMLLREQDAGRSTDDARRVLQATLDEASLPRRFRALVHTHLGADALRQGRLDPAGLALARARREFEAAELEGASRSEFVAVLCGHEARLALARGAGPDELRRCHAALARAWTELLDAWSRAPFRAGGLGFLHWAERRQVLVDLMHTTLALDPSEKGREACIEELLRAQRMGSLARELEVEGSDLARVRRDLLGDGRAAWTVLPGREASIAFVIRADGITAWSLPREPELLERVRALERGLARRRGSAGSTQELERAAGALAEWLLPEPARAALGRASGLIVVGADLLRLVPLELLPYAGGRLGERLAVSHLPSLPLGCHLHQRQAERPAPPQPEILVLAADRPAPSELERWRLAPLPVRDEDLARWVEAYPAPGRRVVRGPGATREALAGPESARRSVWHLLAHGIFDATRERGAGLVLAPTADDDDGILTCDQVEAELEPGPLVILSACGSARGPWRPGEDRLAHLAGAFLSAGASTVLSSQVEIEYHTTVALMEVFHRGLARGEAPAEALRAARAALAADGEEASYLAQTQVFGLGHQPLFARPARRAVPGRAASGVLAPGVLALGGALALVVALGAVALVTRRRARRRRATKAA